MVFLSVPILSPSTSTLYRVRYQQSPVASHQPPFTIHYHLLPPLPFIIQVIHCPLHFRREHSNPQETVGSTRKSLSPLDTLPDLNISHHTEYHHIPSHPIPSHLISSHLVRPSLHHSSTSSTGRNRKSTRQEGLLVVDSLTIFLTLILQPRSSDRQLA